MMIIFYIIYEFDNINKYYNIPYEKSKWMV
jgi:hypothetical protein